MLSECSDVLQAARVLEAAQVTAKGIPCKSKESCRAIVESFCPATNTFITPNFEEGFSLLEINEVFGLPILGDLYEEFIPVDSHLISEPEEFRVGFQQVFSLDEMSRDECQKAKANLWIKNMLPKG